MTVLEALLALQEFDTRIDQLDHRLSRLDERDARDEHLEVLAAHERSTAEVQSQRDELGRRQKRLEDEVATVSAKAGEVEATLYSGSVTSPRELQALQDELGSVRRRQQVLEDQLLELMVEAEPLDADLSARAELRVSLDATGARLELALAEAEAELVAQRAEVVGQREAAAAAMDAELLARYDRMRAQLGGVAVARLVGGSCGGCHLQLSAVELDRVRRLPPDALPTCEECGRLLVR